MDPRNHDRRAREASFVKKYLTYGMVGGSLTAFIGAVHRIGAGFDGIASLAAGC